MLTVFGPHARYCDGVSRRSFLKVGALGVGGLTLPQLLRAEAAGGKKSHKSVIMVYLSGGMAHQDTFDLKPNGPAELKGEFKPIPTNVTGIQFGEHLPKLAQCADKLAVIRSLVGQRDEHSSWQSMTGTTMDAAKRENKPHFGSVVARVQGQTDPTVPAFVDLSPTMQHKPYNSPGPANLGRSAAPAKVDGDELAVMKNLAVTPAELQNRKALLEQMDAFRRAAGHTNAVSADTFHDRAFDVLTSSKLVEALDVTKEPARTRERYGKGSPKHLGDGAPMWNDQLLMARRLVEAGCRVVTVAYGFWDTHGGNFRYLKDHLPLFDTGISALVEDVYARGLDGDVTVCVWGEFGRTPKINKDAGRDHWARVNFALMSGGGMRTGQVIGSTDSAAAEAKDDPVPYAGVLASVYKNLGLDPHAMVYDVSNRPNPILPGGVLPVDKLY
ncbi:DUF1501 domain-containing protein [Frigoriglobus tundricola]|uniref:Uncharacterized DUF1501 protein, type 2 n=1 Tax=Frigoriglobus tundricola TaxID=2774151 RepID=A0A6M5YY98_9BACT|nr:DUF1501 domain-containing protein [Frigoriglobus tundricola]QJW98221.1 Uncharacterized DUF1501 protein, type 2 [Frigoriglobus tundricola]